MKFRIYGQAFVDELLAANDLDPSKTYKVYGEYSAEHNAAIFHLKVLQHQQCDMKVMLIIGRYFAAERMAPSIWLLICSGVSSKSYLIH